MSPPALAHELYPPPSFLVPDDVFSAETERDNVGVGGLPSETHLVLLCLDYLRELRRSYSPKNLRAAEGLDADWLSVACYALNRSFVRPGHLRHSSREEDEDKDDRNTDPSRQEKGNDAWFDPEAGSLSARGCPMPLRWMQIRAGLGSSSRDGAGAGGQSLFDAESVVLPCMEEIESEILSDRDPRRREGLPADADPAADGDDPMNWYEYEDNHRSNSHRFFPLNGLAPGVAADDGAIGVFGPLSLGEIAAAGLAGLSARTRLDAEREMVRTPLFEQFLNAVSSKGFFVITDAAVSSEGPGLVQGEITTKDIDKRKKVIYEERYCKVVSKFRTKLAKKAFAASGNMYDMQNAGSGLVGVSSSFESANAKTIGDATNQSSGSGGTSLVAVTAAERQRRRRERRIEACAAIDQGAEPSANTASASVAHIPPAKKLLSPPGADGPTSRPPQGLRSPLRNCSRSNLEPGGAVDTGVPDTTTEAHTGKSLQATTSSGKGEEVILFAPPSGAEATEQTSAVHHHPPMTATREEESPTSRNKPYSSSDLDKAERIKSSGNLYMQHQDYRSAVKRYTAAIELVPLGPNSHVYLCSRAAAFLSLQCLEEAIADSQRSLSLRPDYAKAHARKGLAHFLLGNYQEAVEAYESALKQEPDNRGNRAYLDKAKRKIRKQIEKEAVVAERVGCFNENNYSPRREHRSRGGTKDRHTKLEEGSGAEAPPDWVGRFCNTRSNDKKQRDSKADYGMDLPPQSGSRDSSERRSRDTVLFEADSLKSRGNSCMSSQNFVGALKAYTKALELSPSGPSSHIFFSNRAAALCYLERYVEAEIDSARALALKPKFGKAHAMLGLSRFFLGNDVGAIEAYEVALRYDPDNAASQSNLEKALHRLEVSKERKTDHGGRRDDRSEEKSVLPSSYMEESKLAETNPDAAMQEMGSMGLRQAVEEDIEADWDDATIEFSIIQRLHIRSP